MLGYKVYCMHKGSGYMKLTNKKYVLFSLIIMALSIVAAGCGSFIAGDSETEDALAGEHGELPEWLSLSSHSLRDVSKADDPEKSDGGNHSETGASGLVADDNVESPAASTLQPSAETPQQEKPEAEQDSSGAEPGTMAWIEEQQKQIEAAKRQREKERIQANLEEELADDEDEDAWWDLQKKDEPSMSYQVID